MIRKAITAVLLCLGLCAVGRDFDAELVRSGYVHTPLRLTDTLSMDAVAMQKTVLRSMPLEGVWQTGGQHVLPGDSTLLRVNFDTGKLRATGSPDDPDYALYGHAVATLPLGGVSLNGYNRLYIEIEPRCPGMRVVNINLSFNNRNRNAAGYNAPTGAHLIQLDNNSVCRRCLEIADLQRDAVESIVLSVSVNGRDLPSQSVAEFRIRRLEAQYVENPEKTSGWIPDARNIVYSTSGYQTGAGKSAIVNDCWCGKEFRLTDCESGGCVFRGKVKRVKTSVGSYGVLDFSGFDTPGVYRLSCGNMTSGDFALGGTELWDPSCWKVMNFIFCQRCGYPVPGVHSCCHTGLFSVLDGKKRPYAGGWHDAGDLSQQTLQTADVVYSLLELYEHRREDNPSLAARLREEALWGLDFVLRQHLGDGWHASSMGLLLWQDNDVDSHDDIFTVRKQNCAYDNYLYAAYLAYAARVLGADGRDPEFAGYLRRLAEEDYGFACSKFAESGYGGWISPYEHTYCTGESQWEATASWAASQLYMLTGDSRYAGDARRHMEYVLECQQAEPVAKDMPYGFFYRDRSRRSVVHFIHQSREQLFMQALDALCESQTGHADMPKWHNAMEAYGGYVKSLMKYTAPYGMIPAGVYRDGEEKDTAAFSALHLFPPSDAAERYGIQTAGGVDVAPGWYVKRFPVWFNIFNGNLAVHMSMGKAAAICGRRLNDKELTDIAREQLYWTVGKNPFAQSLIYGEGCRFPSLNNFSSGEIVGAMPVGIRSLDDSDEPYWPNINNACYKEVWVTSAGKWLSLIAEL